MDIDEMRGLYERGASLKQISAATGENYSRVRQALLAAGCVLRSRAAGVRLASQQGRLGASISRPKSAEHREKLRNSHLKRADIHAAGVSQKASGYRVITRGPNKDRGEHRVIVEHKIGRGLDRREHVHHIDHCRNNNDTSNLVVLSIEEHARLHRLEGDKTSW
jgi:hypothetical protein